MAPISISEKRFREGLGQRYMADGLTTRCQAVSKTKLRAYQQEHNDFNLTAEDAWPAAQCERAAVPGKLVCGGRGGHGGGSPTVPTYDMIDFMPADMAGMMREVIKNPQLLSRRFEMTQLVSRILLLYQRLQDQEAAGAWTLEDLRLGLADVKRGDITVGVAKIEKALESRQVERETYNDIFAAMNLLKDMTRTEMSTIKELRQIITFEQMVAGLMGVADSLNEALDNYVADESIRRLVAAHVGRSITERFNLRFGAVLPEATEVIEADYTAAE